jgi:energy-coupling factor transport system substrate-specific component
VNRRILKILVNLTVISLGLLSLLAPFIFEQARRPGYSNTSFPLTISLILILCILLILFDVQSSLLDSKMIAFLGVLIAINAGLRFLENAIPGPAGFSPTFFLIILVGYAFGERMGFLMGAMTMFVSGLITGGVGPWLPGQMITAGWVGQSAAVLKPIAKMMRWEGKPAEVILLSAFGAFWGLFFGLIMNLWFWPFLVGASGQSWMPTAGLVENLQQYGVYYLATSLVWDLTRSVGNILITLGLARPVMKIFQRFQERFSFTIKEVREI